ncbi:MAG: threonine--tRNA ligase [bacterium]|nr:threonine--tRNA ligase [bacterium]
MKINLPDSSIEELPENASGIDLARKVKKSFEGPALAVKINGQLKDLNTALKDGDQAEILSFSSDEGKALFWHSSAHLMAQAIQRLFPEAQPTIGPSIEQGFYYDFANLEIHEEDLERIETEMLKIVSERPEPQRIEYTSKAEALAQFGSNPFKQEMIEQLEEGLSAYQQGDFVDLCRGPHLPHLGLVQAVKVLKTSGAYWRADATKEQLTRVYGISFPDKKQLKAYLTFLEEAKKRDHRILGRQLGLFSFHPEGPGMPFFHPKGMILWDELMAYWEEEHKKEGYLKIKTPVMLSQELWERSGHWGYYRENMYVSEIEDKHFAIKPMNCPGAMLFYNEGQYSYRQLPLRIGEIGNVHRHEMSGALSGLFRVRSFHQDDAHIYMKPEDVESEILNVLQLADRMYSTFGLTYHLELSTRPEKSIGTDADWELATNALIHALQQGGHDYVVNPGDGAFYGPKVDIHIKDAIGRTWQCGTIQLDMFLPERFDLSYIAQDGSKKRPVMIHRVVYGSIERFYGILVEHYAGKLPLWLAPEQLRIIAISETHHDYAQQILAQFRAAGLRAEADLESESVNKKIRSAQVDQINYILVVGDQEIEAGTATVRAGNQVLGAQPIERIIAALTDEIMSRADRRNLV